MAADGDDGDDDVGKTLLYDMTSSENPGKNVRIFSSPVTPVQGMVFLLCLC